jgi:hypothetical protein
LRSIRELSAMLSSLASFTSAQLRPTKNHSQ